VVAHADPPETKPAKQSLEYKPAVGGTVTVRGFRALVLLTLVNTVLLAGFVLGPQLFPVIQQQWQKWQARRAEEKAKQAALTLQQQCMTYSPPAGRVVYEEDPAEIARLLKEQGGTYHSPARQVGNAPPGWVAPLSAVPPPFFSSGRDYALLFLHERTTPGGVKHLVWVQLAPDYRFERANQTDENGRIASATFKLLRRRAVLASSRPVGDEGLTNGRTQQRLAEIVLPDTASHEVARVAAGAPIDQPPPIDYGNRLRVYAGQPDPADESHFTIGYRLDGRDGVIDGWLKDDGLSLRPREGTWSFSASGEAWELPAGTTTAPTSQPQG
jgi:hypothetical protein